MKKNKGLTKFLAIALSLVLLVMAVPASVSADDTAGLNEIPYSTEDYAYGWDSYKMYSADEAAAVGVPDGYSGYVMALTRNSSAMSIGIDFSDRKIAVTDIEEIVFRVYSNNTNEVRITDSTTASSRWFMRYTATNGQWTDISLKADGTNFNGSFTMSSFADTNGYLKRFSLCFRLLSTANTTCYIDSITVKLSAGAEIPYSDSVSAYGYDSYKMYSETEAAEANVPAGYSGYVFALTGSSTGIGIDFSDKNIPVSTIAEMTFRLYCENVRAVRLTTAAGTSSGPWIANYTSLPNNEWFEVTFKSDGTNFNADYDGFYEFADENGYLQKFQLCFRANSSGTCYIDSVIIKYKDVDTVAPVITYNGETDITATAGKTITFDATAYDEYEAANIEIEYLWSQGALDSDGLLCEGSHTCTLKATDSAGNVSEVTVNVTVAPKDTEAPVISYTVTEIYAEAGSRPIFDISATDNDSAELTKVWSVDALDDYGRLTLGTHTLTVTATDPTGNTAQNIILFNVTETAETVGDLYEDPEIVPDYGDVNDDGEIDVLDFIRLKKYFSAPSDVTVNALNADCNKDGKLDTNDLVMLKKHLLGVVSLSE